jgi:hypothetical protein
LAHEVRNHPKRHQSKISSHASQLILIFISNTVPRVMPLSLLAKAQISGADEPVRGNVARTAASGASKEGRKASHGSFVGFAAQRKTDTRENYASLNFWAVSGQVFATEMAFMQERQQQLCVRVHLLGYFCSTVDMTEWR